MKLPAAPLLHAIESHGGLHALLVRAGVPNQSAEYDRCVTAVRRAKETGHLTAAAADTLTIRLLASHPTEIFGQAWWAA